MPWGERPGRSGRPQTLPLRDPPATEVSPCSCQSLVPFCPDPAIGRRQRVRYCRLLLLQRTSWFLHPVIDAAKESQGAKNILYKLLTDNRVETKAQTLSEFPIHAGRDFYQSQESILNRATATTRAPARPRPTQ